MQLSRLTNPADMPPALLLLLLLPALAAARLFHSLPPDTHAFPKFRVAFLNGRPVLDDTAALWLTHGLRGGQAEFFDQPSHGGTWQTPSTGKEVGSADVHHSDVRDFSRFAPPSNDVSRPLLQTIPLSS